MSKSPSQPLKFALLGLLFQRPMSGYDIRKLFTVSPLKMFSPSPGSIYPALHRLRDDGLIESANEASHSGRRKELFKLNDNGLHELKEWLTAPITQDDVIWSLGEMQLKFAFIGEVLGLETAIRFLTEFERELNSYLAYLKDFYKAIEKAENIYGRLAFECGIEGYRTHAEWASRALSQLIEKAKEDHGG